MQFLPCIFQQIKLSVFRWINFEHHGFFREELTDMRCHLSLCSVFGSDAFDNQRQTFFVTLAKLRIH